MAEAAGDELVKKHGGLDLPRRSQGGQDIDLSPVVHGFKANQMGHISCLYIEMSPTLHIGEESLDDPAEETRVQPFVVVMVKDLMGAKAGRECAPGPAVEQFPEDAVQDHVAVDRRATGSHRLMWPRRLIFDALACGKLQK